MVRHRGLGQHGPQHGARRRMERARLSEGALLALRTGRGAWHAEAIGADELADGQTDAEFRGVLFWVNLARRDKEMEPSALVLQRGDPGSAGGRRVGSHPRGRGLSRSSRNARAHPRHRAADGWGGHHTVPPEFQGFAYVLEGEAAFGANRRRARPPQLVLLGRGDEFRVTDASPGTRYLLMAGRPYGEAPVFNGPTWTRPDPGRR